MKSLTTLEIKHDLILYEAYKMTQYLASSWGIAVTPVFKDSYHTYADIHSYNKTGTYRIIFGAKLLRQFAIHGYCEYKSLSHLLPVGRCDGKESSHITAIHEIAHLIQYHLDGYCSYHKPPFESIYKELLDMYLDYIQ